MLRSASVAPMHALAIKTKLCQLNEPRNSISLHQHRRLIFLNPRSNLRFSSVKAAMASGSEREILPLSLTSTSQAPTLFDGATRLYISYVCPYAQRVWIIRNCKGLQDTIKLVPIDLVDRPTWYKEKVYPPNKVPSLEHNNEVKGESLDLIKYIDTNFDGPPFYPDDSARKDFAELLLSYADSLHKAVISFLREESNEIDAGFDYIETALSKFDDGAFFLGQFSLVDIAYAPFLERYHPALLDIKQYDITSGRPNLARMIEEMNKIEGYIQTKIDPKRHIDVYRRRYLANL